MADNTVQLEDDGPSSWSNGEGWMVTQEKPVIKGLTDEQAEYLVENQPFFRPDGDPEENSIRPVVGTDLRDDSDGVEAMASPTATTATQEETADAPFDPSDETVSSTEEILDNNDFSRAELLALKESEQSQDDSDGVMDAIDTKLDDDE